MYMFTTFKQATGPQAFKQLLVNYPDLSDNHFPQ